MNKGHGTLPASRIVALDVLRGVAILGTLLTNIWIFANLARDFDTVLSTSTMAQEVRHWFTGSATGPKDELLVDFLLYLISDGKFLGLLTIMFGIGMEIQRQSALRRGRTWPGGYRWRAGLLVLEGLLHYIFVFSYDVLMGYGLIALVVAGLLARSEKVQNWAIGLSLSAHLVVLGLITVSNWQGKHAADMDINAMDDDANIWEELFPDTSHYWPMVQDRLADFWSGRYEVAIMFAMGIALFLIGARLYRAGLFLPAQGRLRRRVLLLAFGVGLPLDWALRSFATMDASAITRYLTSSFVAFGILAAVAEFYVRKNNHAGFIGRCLEAVGRMALTCYILQNILASLIFYDFGLGITHAISGRGQTWWVLGIYLGICAFLVAFSRLWLARFSRGPIELVLAAALRRLDSGKAEAARQPVPAVAG